jgi:nitronate monooxygenase
MASFRIIQGGMGVAVSSWRLANTVSSLGQLGVVSGTALDQVFARRLQDGDEGGHMRRALDNFPFPAMAERVRNAWFIEGGKASTAPYRKVPSNQKEAPRALQELLLTANFAEVFLAKQGHSNPVGINFLEKIQMPHLVSIYGAMLAGADYILMGAGIPTRIPGILDLYVNHEPATYPLYVAGAQPGDDTTMRFDPRDYMERDLPPLRRPNFLAIIASNTLAITLLKKSNGRVDGFIIEGPTAGGHNAPPRGKLQLNEAGEPIYGDRDVVDLVKMCELGVPFYLAGGYGTAERVREALESGAAGVQVGTPFAFCNESGLREDYRFALLEKAAAGEARVATDPNASPTGFPFKVAQLAGTVSDNDVYQARPRVCDLGYLREAFRTAEGGIDYRCASEPVTVYLSKGGKLEDSVGRKCICNGLFANINQPQRRGNGRVETGVITAGDDLASLARFLPADGLRYSAADVVGRLMVGVEEFEQAQMEREAAPVGA